MFGAVIRNVGVRNYLINGVSARIGGLAAYVITDKPIENCFVEGTLNTFGKGTSIGGMFGYLQGYAVNCYAGVDITVTYDCSPDKYVSEVRIGGFAASVAKGKATLPDASGIYCDVNKSGAENCYASGNIRITGGYPSIRHNLGEFVGNAGNYDTYKNCFVVGTIDFTGYSSGSISGEYCGKFVGYGSSYSATVENLYECVSVIGYEDLQSYYDCTEATREELGSLAFLETNMNFDGSIWAEKADGLPVLKAYVNA